MFRFLHAADIHLDSPLHGLARYAEAPEEEIRGATKKAFTAMIDHALVEKIPLLILAGDLYDGDWNDFNTGLYLAGQLARLKETGARVVIARGNHDAQNRMTRSLPLPDNVHVFETGRPQTLVIGDVAIHGQSFDRADVVENLATGYPSRIEGKCNIGVLHTAVAGTSGHAQYAPCSLQDLLAKDYDYWALGHVHEHRVLHRDPWVVYSGCIQGRHIREQGPKGCVQAEVGDTGVRNAVHLTFDVMRWTQAVIDLSGAATRDSFALSVEQRLAGLLKSDHNLPQALRIVLGGRTPLHSWLVRSGEEAAATVRALVTDLSGGRDWVEKVMIRTSAAVDLAGLKGSDTPQGDLLRYLDELMDVDRFGELGVDLTALAAKLAGTGIGLPDLGDPAVIRTVLAEVRDLLLPFLAETEGDLRS